MKNKNCRTPDEKWKWVIAFAVFCIGVILGGILRTVGVLLVAFMSEFGVSRKEASMPLIVYLTASNIIGVLVGPLSQRYGIRSTTVAGSLLGAVGLAMCFFATDLRIVTISLGIFGCGHSFSYTVVSVLLNRYFSNNRASINGIVFSGPCVGTFLFPSLYEYLIATYGLRGSLLIMSGIVLQICVFGFLLRPPQLHDGSETGSKFQKCSSTHIESIDEPCATDLLLKESEKSEIVQTSNEIVQMEDKKIDECSAIENVKKTKVRELFQEAEIARFFEQKEQIVKNKIMKNGNKKMEDMLILDTDGNKNNEQEGSINGLSSCELRLDNYKLKKITLFTRNLENSPHDSECYEISSDIFIHQTEVNKGEIDVLQVRRPLSILEAFKCVLSCRSFYFYSITIIIFCFTFQLFLVIIVDFYMDRSIAEADTKYMFFSFAIFDILGRLAVGWITDRNYLKRSKFLILSMTTTAVLFLSFPFASTFLTLNFITSAYGFFFGSTFIIFKVIPLDFLPSEVQEVAFGCAGFFYGTTTFTYVFLIEHFRDESGSYSNIFFILAFMSLVASLLWILESYLPEKSKIEMKY